MPAESVYLVQQNTESGTYDVLAPDGRCVLSCRLAREAEQYATILTQAYQAGYRQGFRDARQ